ncbi:SAUR-like auxin-responsive protein family [Striga asiatica]|uniref:SAUR-like auxin-responsive protein family n=1 Tax=Striga asiatica TaxID=4170 RepID=A0A5A7QDP7_STRAF|nr:SAUR-like auxin-responsive protein family [Striga asiatica]
MKKLAKKKAKKTNVEPYECLLPDKDCDVGPTTPNGSFVVYVGEDRMRFVLPTGYLSHPLFKILLEKAYNEFGFEQKNGLVVPCSVAAFREVVNAVESCHGRFDFGELMEEFL